MIKTHLVDQFTGLCNAIAVSENSFLDVCCKASAVGDLSASSYMID